MEYTLDTNAAKQADQINARIDQQGKYLGTFTRAESVTSKKGTQGIDFSFKTDGGATADYLTVWTHNADGKQLMGYNLVMAIMTCLRVKGLKAADGEVEKYDSELQKRVKKTVPLFAELMGKPIGLLIHMEEYQKNNGDTAWKPAITAPFDKDEFTASEILSKAIQPVMVGKMVAVLRDRPLKASAQTASNAPSGGDFQDFEDDIPF